MNRRGQWSTPIQGDKGFPDLVLCHPTRHRTLFVELKAEQGTIETEQREWLAALQASGLETRIWRPSDWCAGVIEFDLSYDDAALARVRAGAS